MSIPHRQLCVCFFLVRLWLRGNRNSLVGEPHHGTIHVNLIHMEIAVPNHVGWTCGVGEAVAG